MPGLYISRRLYPVALDMSFTNTQNASSSGIFSSSIPTINALLNMPEEDAFSSSIPTINALP